MHYSLFQYMFLYILAYLQTQEGSIDLSVDIFLFASIASLSAVSH